MSNHLCLVVRLLLLACALPLLAACTDPSESSTQESSGDSTPTPTEGEPTPEPTGTPTPSARIANFHLWKDGCDSELWGRWNSGDDYSLEVFQVRTEAGTLVASVTYGDLSFEGGMEEVWRFFDESSFPASRYRVLFLFGDGTEHEETVDLDPTFFEGPAILSVGNVVADGPNGGLAVYVGSDISGSVQRISVYDANRCRVYWKIFYTEPQLSSGSTTRLDVGGYFASGTELLLAVEGVDAALAYTYYTTVSVTIP